MKVTKHAKKRIEERGYSMDKIQLILNKKKELEVIMEKQCIRYIYKKHLHIIVEKTNQRIITVYYRRKYN
jgi:hypothetical protein